MSTWFHEKWCKKEEVGTKRADLPKSKNAALLPFTTSNLGHSLFHQTIQCPPILHRQMYKSVLVGGSCFVGGEQNLRDRHFTLVVTPIQEWRTNWIGLGKKY